jgi:A/G-specific adenine glycosylase
LRHQDLNPPALPLDAAVLQRRLLSWYRRHRRRLPWRDSHDPYAIWISEVMLQQTQVNTVLPYYTRFLERFPNVTALAAAAQDEVLKHWEGLGYYARARNLHRAARRVLQEHGGQVPVATEHFRRLPGIGTYIAAAVGSIAFGLPLAAVDGNVMRVLARLLAIETARNAPGATRCFQAAADALLHRRHAGLHNQAMMELGALVCTPRHPECPRCPWGAACRARRAGRVEELPRRMARSAVPEQRLALAVIWRRGRLLAIRRPDPGLLGGLWQLPGGALNDERQPEAACRDAVHQATGLAVSVEKRLCSLRHAYSHFRLAAQLFLCRWQAGRVRLPGSGQVSRWVTVAEFAALPLSALERKCLAWIVPR